LFGCLFQRLDAIVEDAPGALAAVDEDGALGEQVSRAIDELRGGVHVLRRQSFFH